MFKKNNSSAQNAGRSEVSSRVDTAVNSFLSTGQNPSPVNNVNPPAWQSFAMVFRDTNHDQLVRIVNDYAWRHNLAPISISVTHSKELLTYFHAFVIFENRKLPSDSPSPVVSREE